MSETHPNPRAATACPTCGAPARATGGAFVVAAPDLVERLQQVVTAAGMVGAAECFGVSREAIRKMLRGQPVRKGTVLLATIRASSVGGQPEARP